MLERLRPVRGGAAMQAGFPLDRAPHEALVTAVLAWKDPDLEPATTSRLPFSSPGTPARSPPTSGVSPPPCPRASAAALSPKSSSAKPNRLSAPLQGTARCAQNCARLVRALYTRVDRLTEPAPAAT